VKAIIYTKYGPPDVLQLKEVEKPIPKDDEVLIKVHAAEATKADCELRSFNFPVKWFWLPLRIAMGLTKPKGNRGHPIVPLSSIKLINLKSQYIRMFRKTHLLKTQLSFAL
jgi:hypothetical protein